jgi:hypothetical protein
MKPISFVPKNKLYKIIDILTYKNLVWQILFDYMLTNLSRAIYLKQLLVSVISCGQIKNGYSVHKCERCGSEKKIPFSCGKRFCNKCGYRRTENWVSRAQSKVLQVSHRHIIVTMPDVLWAIFSYERELLKLIPQIGYQVLQLWGHEKGIVKQGIISIIHTFGYDIKWNPHGHFIVTEGGLTANNTWKSWPWNKKKHKQPYISFAFLQTMWRKLFVKALFSNLDKIWDQNSMLRNYIYQTVLKIKQNQYEQEKHKKKRDRHRITFRNKASRRDLTDLKQYVSNQQWYVNAESRLSNGEHTIGYVGRYSNRPSMAECRITSFDGEIVTFWYDEKEKLDRSHVTKRRKVMSLPIKVFIKRILRHIPDKGFRMIEWHGLYASSIWSKTKILLMKLGKYVIKKIIRLTYRKSIKKYFGYDPLKCKLCGGEMLLYTINYYKNGVLRVKRYLGANGYISKMTNRIYSYDLNKYFKIESCGQIALI